MLAVSLLIFLQPIGKLLRAARERSASFQGERTSGQRPQPERSAAVLQQMSCFFSRRCVCLGSHIEHLPPSHQSCR